MVKTGRHLISTLDIGSAVSVKAIYLGKTSRAELQNTFREYISAQNGGKSLMLEGFRKANEELLPTNKAKALAQTACAFCWFEKKSLCRRGWRGLSKSPCDSEWDNVNVSERHRNEPLAPSMAAEQVEAFVNELRKLPFRGFPSSQKNGDVQRKARTCLRGRGGGRECLGVLGAWIGCSHFLSSPSFYFSRG